MKSHGQRSSSGAVSLLLTLLLGAPAIADDTELMLLTPATVEDNKPNILFILDTSGSMGEIVQTQAPYDHNEDYAGDCETGNLYWTDVDVTPDCSDPANNRFFAKTAFKCAAANGQLIGIGSYTGTMVQHRETAVPDVSRWQEIQAGNDSDIVECEADSGVHGDGSNNFDLWASNGSDGSVFTDDSTLEIAWGSAPAAVTYTVYDGNYLNWKNAPETVNMAKIDVLKAVTTAVLNSISDVNVGIMRFNGNNGGPVIKAMSDLDADRANIISTVQGLPADGNTPLSETMYEAALYWRGMNAHFASETFDPALALTDPAALESTGPADYRQPETNVCSKNFNVLLTDGEPVNDADTPDLVGNLPDFGAACDGDSAILGYCLDDVAQYLSSVDIDTAAEGDQVVTTHTIGFDIDLDIMRETAEDSGGTYFLADDVDTLAQALLNIISDITQRSLSFSAPAVSVNSFNRTQNLNDLYMTVFASRAKVHWPGNLKKFRVEDGVIVDATGEAAVDPSTGFFYDSVERTSKSIWTDGVADGNDVTLGGAAHELPLPDARELYTNNGASNDLSAAVNAISPANSAAFVPADFGLTGAAGEPTMDELIRWMRGEDIRNEDFDADTTVRNVIGDPLHSRPAAVVYGGAPDAPDVVVFAATNDGYLHAIDGDDGHELWAFVPNEFLPHMNRLFFDPRSNFKHYGIDGNVVPVMLDNDNDGSIEPGDGDFVYVVFGLRRGGRSYYALDVTNRSSPQLLWMAQYPEFGQSWSTPVIARVELDGAVQNDEHAVVIVGGGYDPVHDTRAHPSLPDAQGAGIHMLDLETGDRLWRAGPDIDADLQLDDMTRAIPTDVRVIDINGDGLADRMYASDLGGQIWRFDVTNGNAASTLVAGGVIAQLGAEGLADPTVADTRRFYASPDVAIFSDPFQGRRFISISIGSGYRAHPLDETATDRFFSLRDPDVFNALTQDEYDNYDIITDGDLEEVSGKVNVVIESDDRGWKFTLPANQSIFTASATFNDSVFFVGFSPEENTANPCQPGSGRNFLYQVSVVNGDPIVALEGQVPADPDAERVTDLAQGGIAPSPTFLFPGSTDPNCDGPDCVEPPIGCVGVECFNPGLENNPVRTLWTQDGIE